MPIEVKELIIKVSVSETEKQTQTDLPLSPAGLAQLQAGIVEACLKKVFEKLKEREEP